MSPELEPYDVPTIEDIPLIAEEQVLAACKVANAGNTSGTGLHCNQDQTTCTASGTS